MQNIATKLTKVINPYLCDVNKSVKNIVACNTTALFKQDKPTLFNREADLLNILVDNYLSYSPVVFKQLSRILSLPPNTCIDRHLAITKIIMIR